MLGVCCFQARIVNNDFNRYNVSGTDKADNDDDDDDDDIEDYGWKLLHGDVFRYPPHRSLFCAILGELVVVVRLLRVRLCSVA